MYTGSISHDDIIAAFRDNVPDCYVRDYRDNGGYITICRGYKSIPWGGQTTTTPVYRHVPKTTLVNLPRGFVTSATHYRGAALVRPGWRTEFRKAMRHLTQAQMKRITKTLRVGEVFPGVS